MTAGFTLRGENGVIRRKAIADEVEAAGKSVIRPIQIHGNRVVCIRERPEPGLLEIENTDGLITDIPGVILTSSHGDCLPIYMYDPEHHAIGLAHAGWRGCLSGIAAEMLRLMEGNYGSNPNKIVIYIGPGIDSCCFEVDFDVAGKFLERYPWMEDRFISRPSGGKYFIDLKGMTMELLELCGVSQIDASPFCTCCRADMFWSYRRAGDKERMLAYMELLPL